jgi:hypothetical protein
VTTDRVSPTRVSPLQGERTELGDHRYRLYTVDHLPFDALPSYADGGPFPVVHVDVPAVPVDEQPVRGRRR